MKSIKKTLAIILASIICISVIVIPVSAASPRWANAYVVQTNVDKNGDIYKDDKSFIKEYEKIYLTSNTFTAAGIVLTDILIEYYFNLTNVFKEWLPKKKRPLHLGELVVDGDILAQKNLVVYGDTASGGGVPQ